MAKLDKLITYAYLREEVDMPNNIPEIELEHKIYSAQETLRMLMGDEFYQDFLVNYRNSTFSSAYNSLYDPYIKQYVAWQAHEYWVQKANFKITPAGFRVYNEDHSVPATDVQMAYIINAAKQKAQYYKQLVVGFLNGNSSNYPLYTTGCRVSNVGNSFHISAVRNNHGHGCKCNSCCTSHRI